MRTRTSATVVVEKSAYLALMAQAEAMAECLTGYAEADSEPETSPACSAATEALSSWQAFKGEL